MENLPENSTLARYYKNKKRRKKRRKLMFYTLLTVFMVLIIAVLSLTVFFNINEFTVEGNSHYSTDEIIHASGLEKGQNMFRLNKFDVIDRIKQSLPYLSDVTINRNLPSTMVISVTETSPFCYLAWQGYFYIMDKELKLLEASEIQPEGLAEIEGIEPVSPQPGQLVADADGKEQTLVKITRSISDNIGAENITSIKISDIYDLSFVYDSRVTVLLGSSERMDEKIKLTKYVLDENESKEHAQIDVSSGTKAYYRAVSVEENEQASENE